TALDVTTQRQILDLIKELQGEHAMSVILITHDVGVAAHYSDHELVMYADRIVECGPTEVVVRHPRMPYTTSLLDSVPTLGSERLSRMPTIDGELISLVARPDGCQFRLRCSRAISRCGVKDPPLDYGGANHAFACWNPVPRRYV